MASKVCGVSSTNLKHRAVALRVVHLVEMTDRVYTTVLCSQTWSVICFSFARNCYRFDWLVFSGNIFGGVRVPDFMLVPADSLLVCRCICVFLSGGELVILMCLL